MATEYTREWVKRTVPLPMLYNKLALEWLGMVSSMLKISDTYSSVFYNALMMVLQEDDMAMGRGMGRGRGGEDLYMRLLNVMDAMLDEELKSDRFAHMLTDYLDSWLSIHAIMRRIYPVRHYDIIFEEMLVEQFRSYTRMLSFMLSTYDLPMDASSYDVIYRKGKTRLLHYRGGRGYPVLIVYAMINRYHIMDVSRDKSVVKRLMDEGLDVYLLDWGHMDYDDEHLSLDDYIHIMDEAVDRVREESGRDRISMLGYCWGGIVSLIYASLYRQKLNSLIVMAAPVDFDRDDGILAVWAKAMDARRLVAEYGHMNGQVLDIAFLLRNPVRYTLMKYLNLLRRLNDRPFVETFFAVERWLYNTPDVPGRFYEQIIEDLYKGNALVKGTLKVHGRSVDLKSIDLPLLTIVAENDDLTAPTSTLAVNDHVSSREKRVMSIPGGHVGLCISSIAHKQLWPNVARWIMEMARMVEENMKMGDRQEEGRGVEEGKGKKAADVSAGG